MPEHTFPLRGRVTRALNLTDEEAVQLHDKGFRFSIFRPGREQCQLSLPYETIINHMHGTITIRQSENEEVPTVREPERTTKMRAVS